jgi:hypothetical protein
VLQLERFRTLLAGEFHIQSFDKICTYLRHSSAFAITLTWLLGRGQVLLVGGSEDGSVSAARFHSNLY